MKRREFINLLAAAGSTLAIIPLACVAGEQPRFTIIDPPVRLSGHYGRFVEMAAAQNYSRDGYRHGRFAIIAPRHSRLRDSIRDHDLQFETFGTVRTNYPMRSTTIIGDVHVQIDFISISNGYDTMKLNGREYTGAWVDGYIDPYTYDSLRARVGRYPRNCIGGCIVE